MQARSKKWWALIGLSLAGFIASLDFTIINTALPSIQVSLKLSIAELQWLMNIFVLAICIFSVVMGRFGDIFGHRKILYWGITIFALSCLVAGITGNAEILIFGRAAQGIGIAMIIPSALALVAHTFPLAEKNKALGIWTTIRALGMAIGPVVAGFILGRFNWRWIFFINIPIILLSSLICLFSVSETDSKREKIDWLGLIFFSLGIGCFTIAIIQIPNWGWDPIKTLSLLIIATVSFIIFFYVELKVENPLINLHLFTYPTFISCAIINFVILFFAYTIFFLAPLYLQYIHHMDAQAVGFMLLPISLGMMLASISANFLHFFAKTKLLIFLSLSLFALSALLQSHFNSSNTILEIESTLLLIIIAWSLMGGAWGFSNVFSISEAISSLPQGTAGITIGTLSTIRNMGGTIGLAIAITLFRHQFNEALTNYLSTASITLSQAQQQLIKVYLSDPQEAQKLIETFKYNPDILDLFQRAFLQGYHSAAKLLLFLILGVLVFMFYMMKRKNAFEF